MSNTKLLPFDLEVALKQPERAVFRNGGKPLEWHYFDKAANDAYPIRFVASDGGMRSCTKEGTYTRCEPLEHPLDLFLLPEFTPEEGKWYWVKTNEEVDFCPMIFSKSRYWGFGVSYEPSELHTIHPEPINPPE
jgi:hypothetical protein